jgi:AraC-like DNA-binding protein
MDALSAVLSSVHMTGAVFFDITCTAPWGFAVPALNTVAHLLAPGTKRLVGYHLVTEGTGVVQFQGRPAVSFAAGDMVIIPHGDPYTVTNGSPSKVTDCSKLFGKYLAGSLGTMRLDGGGEVSHFICAYFGCDRDADRLFLAGLPTVIKMNLRHDAAGAWLENSIRHLVAEAVSGRPGGTILLSRMAEALFVEALRRHMDELSPEQTGWLAGARDPVVGATLALLHRQPCHRWTVEQLADEVGASRSVIAERFARFLGEPPLTYLARWRMRLAARQLQMSRKTILQLAAEVGYESEAAFNRAFKREFGGIAGVCRRRRATLAGRSCRLDADRGREQMAY